MKRFLFGFFLLLAVGVAGLVLWMRSGGGEVVELTDAQRAAAQASGAASKDIVVDPAGEEPLPTLEELKTVADRARVQGYANRIRAERDGAAAAAGSDDRALLTVLLSEVERLLGNLDLAYDLALEGAQALPENSRARHMLAKAILAKILVKAEAGNVAALFGMMGDVKTYKAEVNAAVELDPSNVDARVGQVLTLLLPRPLGNKKRAAELIEEIGVHDPLRRDFWRGQIIAVDDDRLDEAIVAFEKLVEAHPKDPDILLTLGELYIKKDEWSKAMGMFDRQLVEPRTPQAYRALYQGAKARMKAKVKGEEALAMLEEFEAADPVGEPMPTMDRVKYHKGRALMALGRFEEAKVALEEASLLNPASDRAKGALEKVNEALGQEAGGSDG